MSNEQAPIYTMYALEDETHIQFRDRVIARMNEFESQGWTDLTSKWGIDGQVVQVYIYGTNHTKELELTKLELQVTKDLLADLIRTVSLKFDIPIEDEPALAVKDLTDYLERLSDEDFEEKYDNLISWLESNGTDMEFDGGRYTCYYKKELDDQT